MRLLFEHHSLIQYGTVPIVSHYFLVQFVDELVTLVTFGIEEVDVVVVD
jgi:hypothetical protein